ncbi:MAG: hypothetical protein Q9181_001125 [Wetmoreana brouardii]
MDVAECQSQLPENNHHVAFMEHALSCARKSPPAPNKFCVGACLVDADEGRVLSTGYSLELPRNALEDGDQGSTHAEQCCFIKIAQKHGLPEERIGDVLPPNTVLYTTMEPCNKRLSGNRTCVDRILGLRGSVKAIYIGIREPDTFVGKSTGEGNRKLEAAGIRVEFIPETRLERVRAIVAGFFCVFSAV